MGTIDVERENGAVANKITDYHKPVISATGLFHAAGNF